MSTPDSAGKGTRWTTRLVCRLRGHRFDGWPKIRDPFAPLPYAKCGRCGRVL